MSKLDFNLKQNEAINPQKIKLLERLYIHHAEIFLIFVSTASFCTVSLLINFLLFSLTTQVTELKNPNYFNFICYMKDYDITFT